MSNEDGTPKLLNMNGLADSLKVVKGFLNKSLKAGIFESFDETNLVKVSLDNLTLAIETLNVHQAKYLEERNKSTTPPAKNPVKKSEDA
jgi:hypothetical protein